MPTKECPKCGAPLLPSGECEYHQTLRTVPTDASEVTTIVPTNWYATSVLISILIFVISLAYTALGYTFHLFYVPGGAYLLAYIVRGVTALHIGIYYWETRKQKLLGSLFFINTLTAILVLLAKI